jgi:hypothetical protein
MSAAEIGLPAVGLAEAGGEGGIRIASDPTTEKPKTTAFRLIVSGLEQAERCKRMQRGQAKNTRLANPWQIFPSDK